MANSTAQHPLLFPVALSAKNVNDLTRPNSASTASNSASVVHHVSDATYTAVGRPSSGTLGDAVRTGALALTGGCVGALAALAAVVVFTGASSSALATRAFDRAGTVVSHRFPRPASSRVAAPRASKVDRSARFGSEFTRGRLVVRNVAVARARTDVAVQERLLVYVIVRRRHVVPARRRARAREGWAARSEVTSKLCYRASRV